MLNKATLSKLFICVASLLFSAVVVAAGNLTCAQNDSTFQFMCFLNNGVRENGDVRSAKFYKGGPNNVKDTGFTARVHCGSSVLELTDRDGVAFIRNVPTEQVGIDFVRYLCEHKPSKHDPKLKIN
jgi:hypothetical protein